MNLLELLQGRAKMLLNLVVPKRLMGGKELGMLCCCEKDWMPIFIC